jgi:putative SOS response-associated peptidase YedK
MDTRDPVNRHVASLWLIRDEAFVKAKSLLKPYPEELMDAYDVSPVVNSAKYDGPECILPVLENDQRRTGQLSLL